MTNFDFSNLEGYATDKDREASEGVWLKFPGERRVRVLRAGGANRKFSRSFSRIVKPYRRQLERGTLEPEKSDELMLEVYLDSVIIDWDGFNDSNGKPIPYTKQVAREFFTVMPEMFNDIQNIATEMATFQEQEAAEAGEDLGKS
jgi:hypothetical protein